MTEDYKHTSKTAGPQKLILSMHKKTVAFALIQMFTLYA
jgi:hypothetical protein